MAAGYEVGFDHLSMHLPHCVIGQLGIHCLFTNLVICISLFHHGHVDHTHILIAGYIHVVYVM